MTATPHDNPQPLGTARGLAIASMFFFSGAAALVYEVVWTRQLTTLFGATTYAVATVLTAFMGGLALGSWLLGRYADRLKRPLVFYGILEIGTVLGALAFPTALHLIEPVIGKFYTVGGGGTFLLFSLARFVLAAGLLLVPTTLMGATLPVMARAVTGSLSVIGRRVGGLYALNTAGAVAGVFFSGFYLLEHFGVWKSTLVAAACDSLVAVLAIAIGWSLPAAAVPKHAPADDDAAGDELPRRTLRIVLATYLVSGFVALAYQVAWTRSLLFHFDKLKATTFSFAGMLTVFLLGLALGSAIMQALVDKLRDRLAAYGVVQAFLGIAGASSIFLVAMPMPDALILPELRPEDPGALVYWNAVFNVMAKTAIAIGLPTLLMGMAFPLVARLCVGSLGRLGRDLGTVYALNTLGAILGAFVGGFFLIPALGIGKTVIVLATISLLLSVAVFATHPTLAAGRGAVVGIAGALVALGVGAAFGLSARTLKYQNLVIGEKLVFYDEGSLATASVIEDSKGWRTIYVDDVGVAGTDPVLQTDQKTLAHVPMALLGGRAEKVLTVGFGAGGASWSYTLYPQIDEIHAIEITHNVPKAAPSLTAANHGIVYQKSTIERLKTEQPVELPPPGGVHPLKDYTVDLAGGFVTFDPRYRLLIEDARSYLRFTDATYDIIATDCTDLRYKTNANLYDLEYFTLCRERISDRGLVVVWMPLAGLSDEAFRVVVRTFQAVFPDMTVWYFTNQPTHYCLFLGARDGVKISYAEVERALENPAIAADLVEIGLRDPRKLISSFVTDERGIDGYVGDGMLNTEDTPIVEFISPRYGYDSRPIAENMGNLFGVQVPVATLVTDLADAPRGTEEQLGALQRANEIAFEGHVHYRLFEFVEASRCYERALAEAPFDDSLRGLLEFDELRLLLEWELRRPVDGIDEQWVNTQWIAFNLASVFLDQERPADAVTIAMPFVRRTPPPGIPGAPEEIGRIGYSLNLTMAKCYAATGNAARAREFLDAAHAYQPDRKDWADTEAQVLGGAAE